MNSNTLAHTQQDVFFICKQIEVVFLLVKVSNEINNGNLQQLKIAF